MNKVSFTESYINRCAEQHTTESAEILVKGIVSTFSNDINGLTSNLDLNAARHLKGGTTIDYIGDVALLKEQLEFYKSKLLDEEQQQKDELERLRLQAEISKNNVIVNNNNTNNNENSLSSTITITLGQTMSAIAQIPSDVLSDEDKEKLQNDLYTLEGIKTKKNKSKFWDKAKDVIKFLADKGADAAIAAMPYIIQTLSQM